MSDQNQNPSRATPIDNGSQIPHADSAPASGRSPTSVIGGLLARADAWVNELLQLGGPRDPSVYTRNVSRGAGLTDQTLEAMFVEDHLAARTVELVVSHGMRKGWDLKIPLTPQEAAAARGKYSVIEEELGLAPEFAEAAVWARLFGGAITWIGLDEGAGIANFVERQRTPITDETRIDRVSFLHTFDRRELTIVDAYPDPRETMYRAPRIFRIQPSSFVGSGVSTALSSTVVGAGIDVHESRLIAWPGARTTARRRTERNGWDDSVLERAWDALKQAGEDYGAKSQILARWSQFVFKIKNLAGLLVGDQAKFNRRMSLLDGSRSRGKALVIDTDEGVENVQQSGAGIDGMLDKSVERVAMAAGIPASVLIGKPTDTDRDLWDDEVEAWQASVIRPRHERVTRLILRSKSGPTNGKEPETWSIAYRPLRTPKPKERAEIRKLQAETDAIEVDKGIITGADVALHRHVESALGEGEVKLDAQSVAAQLKRQDELRMRPPKDNAELGTVGARDSALDALQKSYFRGEIPKEAALARLELVYQFSSTDAERVLTKPDGWTPAPIIVSGKPGPAPDPQKGTGAGAPQGLPGFDDGGAAGTKTLPPEGSR